MIGMTLACLAIGGWKSMIPGLDFGSSGTPSASSAVNDLELTAAFTAAGSALNTFYSTAGSYIGAELSPTSPVQLAWTGDASYCLQGGTGANELHEMGPGGVPEPGACPAA